MISTIILTAFHSFGIIIFLLGLQGIAFFPLTILYEIWKSKKLRSIPPFDGKISILIPAYNEEKTIRETIISVLKSDYPDIEIIAVNDGSNDGTEDAIRDFIDEKKIKYIKKANGGKASALNRGIDAASGEVVIFTDADSLFLPDTISKTARWFGDKSIDGVCGNDAPLNLSTPIPKFLAITTHISTGFVRRALSMINCLPIITGNLGAVRRSVLKEIGGFREIWGEDLEITFRLHRNKKRIMFDPESRVMAECPGDILSLWKQRIRWMRSYIRIVFLHRNLFLNMKYKPFSFYLPVNFLNMAIVPVLQLILTFIMPWAVFKKEIYFSNTVEIITYLGFMFFLFIAVYSIVLDRSYRDLIYLPYAMMLIIPFSYFYNFVAVYSWFKEFQQAEEKWEKIERRKVLVSGAEMWKTYLAGILILGTLSVSAYYSYDYLQGRRSTLNMTPVSIARDNLPALNLGISTHFDAWDDWRDAIKNVTGRPLSDRVKVVGVGAGRTEWTYFKWKGHEREWSNHQKGTGEDLLLTATRLFHKKGYRVAAIVDPYAPNYIKAHPEMAAIKFDGEKSREQISFTELVEGEYGVHLLDMIGYISRTYPVEIINITELTYYHYSYNEKDLRSYERFTGKKGWPRSFRGEIDRDDQSIWEWRSELMSRYIKKVADIVHKEGKELYIDVPVSWDDFTRNGKESGLDYRRILAYADKIIVWNYFDLENASLEISEDLSRYLTGNFPIDSFYVSIGLWGNRGHIDPAKLSNALYYTLKGGAPFIWVTPNSLVSDRHWESIMPYFK